jgi:hypothetical protein
MPCWLDVPAVGDMGPSWSSAIGGGLGRRGEREGDAAIVDSRACETGVRPQIYGGEELCIQKVGG